MLLHATYQITDCPHGQGVCQDCLLSCAVSSLSRLNHIKAQIFQNKIEALRVVLNGLEWEWGEMGLRHHYLKRSKVTFFPLQLMPCIRLGLFESIFSFHHHPSDLSIIRTSFVIVSLATIRGLSPIILSSLIILTQTELPPPLLSRATPHSKAIYSAQRFFLQSF